MPSEEFELFSVTGQSMAPPDPTNSFARLDLYPLDSWAQRLRSGTTFFPKAPKDNLYGLHKARSAGDLQQLLEIDKRAQHMFIEPVRKQIHEKLGLGLPIAIDPSHPTMTLALPSPILPIKSSQRANSKKGRLPGETDSLAAGRNSETASGVGTTICPTVPDCSHQRTASIAGSDLALSTASDESSLDFADSLPPPPDGGYGWLVVFASMVCFFLTSGVQDTFGMVLETLSAKFDSTPSSTAFVGSLFWGFPLLLSPVSSALTNRFGCRAVTIAGGLIAAFGLLLSSFVENITVLYFTYGIIAGFGISLFSIPSWVIVSFYFERIRAFASGLSLAGAGLGLMCFAYLTPYLTEQYDWDGYLFVLSAIVLNVVWCGFIFRPTETHHECRQRKRLRHMEKLGPRLLGNELGPLAPEQIQASINSTEYQQSDLRTRLQVLRNMLTPPPLANSPGAAPGLSGTPDEKKDTMLEIERLFAEQKSQSENEAHKNEAGSIGLSAENFSILSNTSNSFQVPTSSYTLLLSPSLRIDQPSLLPPIPECESFYGANFRDSVCYSNFCGTCSTLSGPDNAPICSECNKNLERPPQLVGPSPTLNDVEHTPTWTSTFELPLRNTTSGESKTEFCLCKLCGSPFLLGPSHSQSCRLKHEFSVESAITLKCLQQDSIEEPQPPTPDSTKHIALPIQAHELVNSSELPSNVSSSRAKLEEHYQYSETASNAAAAAKGSTLRAHHRSNSFPTPFYSSAPIIGEESAKTSKFGLNELHYSHPSIPIVVEQAADILTEALDNTKRPLLEVSTTSMKSSANGKAKLTSGGSFVGASMIQKEGQSAQMKDSLKAEKQKLHEGHHHHHHHHHNRPMPTTQTKAQRLAHLNSLGLRNRPPNFAPTPPTVWVRVGNRPPLPLPGDLFSRAILNPMTRRDIFYRGTLERVPALKVFKVESCPELHKQIDLGLGEAAKDQASAASLRSPASLIGACIERFRPVVNLSLLGSVLFLVFLLCNFLIYFFSNASYFYLYEFSKEYGLTESNIKIVYAILGIFSIFGQILIGYVGDMPRVNTMVLFSLSCIVCGVSTLVLPLAADFLSASNPNQTTLSHLLAVRYQGVPFDSSMPMRSVEDPEVAPSAGVPTAFYAFALYAVLFSFFFSAPSSLATILMVEFLSLEELTDACAILSFFEGVAAILGPPALGWLYEQFHNYRFAFELSGLGFIIASVLMLIFAIPCIRARFDEEYAREIAEEKQNRAASVSSKSQSPDEAQCHFQNERPSSKAGTHNLDSSTPSPLLPYPLTDDHQARESDSMLNGHKVCSREDSDAQPIQNSPAEQSISDSNVEPSSSATDQSIMLSSKNLIPNKATYSGPAANKGKLMEKPALVVITLGDNVQA